MPTIKDYALSYVRRFGAIVPIRSWGNDKGAYKAPLIKDWTHNPLRTEGEVNSAWDKWKNAGIGLVTGDICGGIIVLDFDNKPDQGINGIDSLREWEHETGLRLPDETWTVTTGGGGQHWYFHTNKSINGFVCGKLGVDLRANGNQVLLPPSMHRSGRRYEWDFHPNDYSLLDADNVVYQFIDYLFRNSTEPNIHGSGNVENEKRLLILPNEIKKGEREDKFKRFVGSLMRIGCTDETIKAAVRMENEAKCIPPFTETELEREIFPAIYRWKKGVSETEWKKAQQLKQQKGQEEWRKMQNLLNSN